jgi:hypothetical protein
MDASGKHFESRLAHVHGLGLPPALALIGAFAMTTSVIRLGFSFSNMKQIKISINKQWNPQTM